MPARLVAGVSIRPFQEVFMRLCLFFFTLMAVVTPGHIYAQGTVQQVVGDLVYVEGLFG